MVFLTVKRDAEVKFLIEAPATTRIGDVAATAAQMHNTIRRIHRLCRESIRLAQHGPVGEYLASAAEDVQPAATACSDTQQAVVSDQTSGAAAGNGSAHAVLCAAAADAPPVPAAAAAVTLTGLSLEEGVGDDALQSGTATVAFEETTASITAAEVPGAAVWADPAAVAAAAADSTAAVQLPPTFSAAEAGERLRLALLAAVELTNPERVDERKLLSPVELATALAAIVEAAAAAGFPAALPQDDPFGQDLSGTRETHEAYRQGMHGDIAPDVAVFWFAGKQLDNDATLAVKVGRHEKTRAVVVLQRAGEAKPPKDAQMEEKEYAEMLSFYNKHQETQKRLDEDMDLSYMNSSWADSTALKRGLNGVTSVRVPGLRGFT